MKLTFNRVQSHGTVKRCMRFLQEKAPVTLKVCGAGYECDFPDLSVKVPFVRLEFEARGRNYSMKLLVNEAKQLGEELISKAREAANRAGVQ